MGRGFCHHKEAVKTVHPLKDCGEKAASQVSRCIIKLLRSGGRARNTKTTINNNTHSSSTLLSTPGLGQAWSSESLGVG